MVTRCWEKCSACLAESYVIGPVALGVDIEGGCDGLHARNAALYLSITSTSIDIARVLADMGFECLRVPPGEAALSASIATGMRSVAEDPDLAGVLIALGDMPLVASSHVRQLIEAFDGSAVASAITGRPQPPTLFGRRHFSALQVLEGGAGARDLLKNARHVEVEPATLFDIDTPEDFTRLSALLG